MKEIIVMYIKYYMVYLCPTYLCPIRIDSISLLIALWDDKYILYYLYGKKSLCNMICVIEKNFVYVGVQEKLILRVLKKKCFNIFLILYISILYIKTTAVMFL